MTHLGTQIATTLGFTVLLAVASILSLGAYISLRYMDDVVLRSRIYMNRKRLVAGFLSVAAGMIIITVIAAIQVGSLLVFDTTSSSWLSSVAAVVSFGLLTWAFYNFWALTKSPRPEGGAAQGRT